VAAHATPGGPIGAEAASADTATGGVACGDGGGGVGRVGGAVCGGTRAGGAVGGARCCGTSGGAAVDGRGLEPLLTAGMAVDERRRGVAAPGLGCASTTRDGGCTADPGRVVLAGTDCGGGTINDCCC